MQSLSLALVNAVQFKGNWAFAFDASLSRPGIFHGNGPTTATFMNQTDGWGRATNPLSRLTPEYVVFDHPFLFLVRDSACGAILFASEVDDPTSWRRRVY